MLMKKRSTSSRNIEKRDDDDIVFDLREQQKKESFLDDIHINIEDGVLTIGWNCTGYRHKKTTGVCCPHNGWGCRCRK